jgi:AmmeMemoRadiSam system protein A
MTFHKDPIVDLARQTVQAWVKEGKLIAPPSPLPEELKAKAGVFVSIHLKDGSLRGCIGTFAPTKSNIALEIIDNAISSASRDPRFPPITKAELADLEISVDILTEPEAIVGKEMLDPRKFGLILEAEDGYRKGLLLPDLEGVDTVEEQIRIVRLKAGIGSTEPVKYYRFEVVRHH